MKVAVEEMESCKRRLVVEAPADVVTKEWERAYDRVQKQARLPGFRKGHVPRSLVKVHFADDVRREVAQHLIPDVYRQALSEVRLDPVGEPDLQDVRFEEGAPLTFTAVVEIKPDIALGDVKGVEVEHTAAPVTGSDADATLVRMRQQQAGFRLPDDYRKEALRGKSGTGELKLIEVKEKILPELNDDFAKSLGEFATLEALRAEVVKQLEARRASEERHAVEEKVVDTLL